MAISTNERKFDNSDAIEKTTLNPELIIESIDGGFGISVLITNTGDESATFITWEIEIEGNYILLERGPIPPWPVIEELPAGESVQVMSFKNSFIFGFGPAEITIIVDSENTDPIRKTSDAMALGFLIGII